MHVGAILLLTGAVGHSIGPRCKSEAIPFFSKAVGLVGAGMVLSALGKLSFRSRLFGFSSLSLLTLAAGDHLTRKAIKKPIPYLSATHDALYARLLPLALGGALLQIGALNFWKGRGLDLSLLWGVPLMLSAFLPKMKPQEKGNNLDSNNILLPSDSEAPSDHEVKEELSRRTRAAQDQAKAICSKVDDWQARYGRLKSAIEAWQPSGDTTEDFRSFVKGAAGWISLRRALEEKKGQVILGLPYDTTQPPPFLLTAYHNKRLELPSPQEFSELAEETGKLGAFRRTDPQRQEEEKLLLDLLKKAEPTLLTLREAALDTTRWESEYRPSVQEYRDEKVARILDAPLPFFSGEYTSNPVWKKLFRLAQSVIKEMETLSVAMDVEEHFPEIRNSWSNSLFTLCVKRRNNLAKDVEAGLVLNVEAERKRLQGLID